MASTSRSEMSTSSSSSSDDELLYIATAVAMEEMKGEARWHGRLIGSRPNLLRGECCWYRDYLSPHPLYPSSYFR